MSNKQNRVIKQMRISEDNTLYIRFRGTTNLIEAKILELKKDEQDKPYYILLDRLIHKQDESSFESHIEDNWGAVFNLSGCFVSCLTRATVA
jgi:hypothetical protein